MALGLLKVICLIWPILKVPIFSIWLILVPFSVLSISCSPTITFRRVDLPQPLRPISATLSVSFTQKLICDKTVLSPKETLMSFSFSFMGFIIATGWWFGNC